ncbi:MAG: hypothetical protein DRR16_23530 [Candidatus Parabeggiatoa sp. nov. 3]|nr:MAG: hypothetical protein DRR00_26840 [Gammaproteobacteria bacterium]RKZ59340.1 MAG: hypothetical protein DRQ99_23875 [Gammaproteobacteria bacterium]RKZ80633.1 MAG: hypothetical protein DRR16_23530 [Gammaproteobacteria bacterium]
MKPSTLSEKGSYNFSDYIEIINYVEDILNYFGYSFQRQECDWERSNYPDEQLDALKSRIKESQPYISMTSEAAKREFMIAPILIEVVSYTHAQLKVEFPLVVNEQLKGIVDYYLESKNNCLIIEAGELEKGFIQLAAELIALDKWLENKTHKLYGAVSMGNIWQFCILDRETKLFTQDLNIWRVPADLDDLLKILIGILSI